MTKSCSTPTEALGKHVMQNRFVLLTAAKNEERYIGQAIQSVLLQTLKPIAWFIVDDGSTDRTAEIVRDHARNYPFIRLVSRERGEARSFGAQYRAINLAYTLTDEEEFDFVGVLDADIELACGDYFERVIAAFSGDPRLGITGGYIFERKGGQWLPRPANSPDAVAGGIQMFRRACFEQIGGYTPLLFGGEDWLAQIDAKRAGWKALALPDLAVYHHRPTSSANGRLKGLFRLGMMDASFGSHPVFEVFKCARRVPEKPLMFGSVVRFGGYLWWWITRRSTLLPAEKSAYLRDEQLTKLYSMFAQVGHGRIGSRRA